MRLKKSVRKVLNVVIVYAIIGFVIFQTSESVKRYNKQERLKNQCNIAVQNVCEK